MEQMLTLLEAARTDASKVAEARQLFQREQAFYRLILDQGVIPIADGAVARIHGSHLPTRAELTAAERRDSVRAGTYSRTSHGKRNGREDLESSMQVRLTQARALSGQTAGIPFRVVADLYQSVTSDERTVNTLVDMWEYARGHGLDGMDQGDRIPLWENYSIAAMTLVDPQFNPYNAYSQQVRTRIVELHLGLTPGTAVSARQRQDAERAVIPALMQSKQYVHDDVLYGVYDQISRRAPLSNEGYVQHVARLRSVRPVFETEYLPYQMGTRRVGAAYVPVDQQSQERLTMARGFLETAVQLARDSGMAADDQLIQAANAWLAATATAPPAARIPVVSDTLFQMALNLSTIREAELWAANAGMRPTGLAAATVTSARDIVGRARTAFLWNYSGLDGTYHPNIPRNYAEEAINMLAPRPLAVSEAPAMFASLAAYATPATEVTVADAANPTSAERRSAAAAAEQRHISLLISLRDEATLFGPSATDRAMSGRSLSGPFGALDFRMGRIGAVDQLGGFPNMERFAGRRRTTVSPVDQHWVPGENPGEEAMASVAHEGLDHYRWGQAYAELFRQTITRGDASTPSLLRMLNNAPDSWPIRTGTPYEAQDRALKTEMQRIAREYGLPADRPLLQSLTDRMAEISVSYSSRDAAAQQREVNRLFLAVLDVRIAELSNRLGGNVVLADGQPIRVQDLKQSTVAGTGAQRSPSPGVRYITRAEAALAEAQRVRRDAAGAMDQDLFAGRIDPRIGIAVAEIGIESLTDGTGGHLTDIPRPTVVTPEISAYVAQDAISIERLSGDPRRVRFSATRTMIQPRTGSAVDLDTYQRQHGQQNLTYYWFMYQVLGPTDSSGSPIQYVLNPQYRESGQPRYLGQVMRGATLSDGTRGDFVVRVRRSGLAASTGPEWVPVVEDNGRVRAENVLYQVRAGTLEPVRDARLERSMSHAEGTQHVCFERASPANTVVEYGDTTPVLIVRPSATRQ
jgi:hypothetical protein